MSEQDREIWNKRYAEGAYAERSHPSPLLGEWMPAAQPGQRALDLACGAGRNSIYLAQAGYQVDAVDISSTGLARATEAARALDLNIHFQEADLETYEPAAGAYDLIIMMRYMNPVLAKAVHTALKVEGFFLCEEHLQVVTPCVELTGPSSNRFRVRPGELLAWSENLRIIKCREQLLEESDNRCSALSQLLTQKKPTPAG